MGDVSYKDYIDARLQDLRSYVDMRFEEREKATTVAFAAAEAKGIQHNGILDMLQKWVRTTITWPILLSCSIGAAAVIGAYEVLAR